jgi:hypothetical protein
MVGLDNVGEITILYQVSMNEVVHTSPRIGSSKEETVMNNLFPKLAENVFFFGSNTENFHNWERAHEIMSQFKIR